MAPYGVISVTRGMGGPVRAAIRGREPTRLGRREQKPPAFARSRRGDHRAENDQTHQKPKRRFQLVHKLRGGAYNDDSERDPETYRDPRLAHSARCRHIADCAVDSDQYPR